MIAREIPVSRLVGRTADRDLERGRLHQGEGADHLAPHAVDGGRREGAVMCGQALAHDLGLAAAAGTTGRPAALRGRDRADQSGAATDRAVQVAVDGVDFLPQASRLGASMSSFCDFAAIQSGGPASRRSRSLIAPASRPAPPLSSRLSGI